MEGARSDASRSFGSAPAFQNLEAATRVAPDAQFGSGRSAEMQGGIAQVVAADHWLVRKLMALVGNPPVTIVLWNGESAFVPFTTSVATVRIRDRLALMRLLSNPELNFGDLYSSGRIAVEGDLIRFLEVVYLGIRNLGGRGPLRWLRHVMGHRRIVNSKPKAWDNIHHHYDIGNGFYQLWLDRAEMQYTCAYYPDPTMALEQAQVAKLHHICRKLRLQPGDNVVEAGCGWGGLARFMARHYGVTVTAYNISREQISYARAEAAMSGLSERVRYVEDDYRNVEGRYDVFVSVGMLEHVGKHGYRNFGQVIVRCLKPDGRGLIHTIGRRSPGAMNSWIERRIFPGAYPPSLAEMLEVFEPNRLVVGDVENLRLHYAQTLRHWLERYEDNIGRVRADFGEAFVRAWRLYLAGSVAAFSTDELQLYQVVFSRVGNNALSWSRAHLYSKAPVH